MLDIARWLAPDARMTEDFDSHAQILRKIAEQIAAEIARTSAPSAWEPSVRQPRDVAREVGDPVPSAALHLAKLAHELKTPLSAIVAASELMRDERFGPVGDERYRTYAAGIYDSAHHALAVINAMLGDAAPDAPDSAAFAELDLNAIASQTAAGVRALLGAAGLTIEHQATEGLPHIVADPVTVRQMLLNLVTNAMRATPAGGHVTLSTAFELAGAVHITVTDTGIGMSELDIARVLTADPALEPPHLTRNPSGGVGLGFPVILSLARRNGATVGITSAESGTRVCITFPASRVIPV